MREIKFRAWIKTTKEMITQETISDYILVGNGTGFGVIDGSDDSEYGTGNVWLEDKDFELMQFTGMLDKNGVEIYEGDILKSNKDMFNYYTEIQPEILYQVKYTDGAYRLFSTDNQNIDLLDMANINSKIVGNIYENPELLGTKSDIAVDIGFKEATNE